ncbi:MAG: hypothetical protein IKG87_00790 [Clostridia bacterium]|nr:hypothetical protein [Clostridia bacterium]
MFTARQIAEFFLAHDDTGLLKDTTLITRNGRKFYRGNARLNKYLHIAQNMYIAKTGEKLFSDDLFAYDNGGVVPDVQEKYSILLNRNKQPDDFPDDVCVFLSRHIAGFYIRPAVFFRPVSL